jgi:hypothetical protein
MQQTIVGSNKYYDYATLKVGCIKAYCNQNQWSRISLLQRGENDTIFSIIFVGREKYHK